MLKYAYKLGSRVSLEHYMVYREWNEEEGFFKIRYKILQGYIHYLQEIDLNPKFELLIANMPSGYGKTYPEKISEAWSFGIDDRGAILSLCSNENVVKGGSRTVINEIKSPWFGEVFPHLKYDEKDKDFFLKVTDGEWKLKNCKLMASYNATTTNSNVVGQRASKRIHIDDLYPDYKEAMNKTTNDTYFNDYQTVWKKRFIQEAKYHKIVVTGTLWSSDDFIARLIAWAKATHEFKKHPKYPFTLISTDGSIAIIQVPALDYETGESVCPELRSTKKILEDKMAIDDYLFQTNFQQIPTDPETLFFSYYKLRTYKEIPHTDYIGSYAVIDATRKSGKDFFAMPIFRKVPNGEKMDYYLSDALFTRTATKDMYDAIVDKIIENHINTLIIESNVTSELKQNIEERLSKNTNINILEKCRENVNYFSSLGYRTLLVGMKILSQKEYDIFSKNSGETFIKVTTNYSHDKTDKKMSLMNDVVCGNFEVIFDKGDNGEDPFEDPIVYDCLKEIKRDEKKNKVFCDIVEYYFSHK